MANVLYLSYTGLTDPLGESQVLQYLLALSRRHRIALITFEKPELAKPEQMQRFAGLCREAGIDWTAMTYHRKPGIPATIYDIANGTRRAIAKAREIDADIVHARSYIAGMMALSVKRATGARYIFDMRGFWADERVDGGIWTKGSTVYRFFKGVERRLFLGADHVVSLTRAGVREFSQFDYLQGRVPPVDVIPTCTNLDLFKATPQPAERPFTLGYVGSAGTWYMFPEVSRAVRILFQIDPAARFLVVNRSEHDYVRKCLTEAGVDLGRVTITPAKFSEVPERISSMSAGIFFIKPVFSKKASCPTKMGEFLACGVPCLANGDVGDVAEDLAETATGVTVTSFDEATLRDALTRLIDVTHDPHIAERCRSAAAERFSLAGGAATYDTIYSRLADVAGGAKAA